MGFKVDEIVITPEGRGVVTALNPDETVSIVLGSQKTTIYAVGDVLYEILPDYEEKKFFIAHETGALQITAQPIRYMDNGVAKIKFEVKTAFDTCKVYRDAEGVWIIDEGEILPRYLEEVGINLRKKYNT
jgi:hypothetical protein